MGEIKLFELSVANKLVLLAAIRFALGCMEPLRFRLFLGYDCLEGWLLAGGFFCALSSSFRALELRYIPVLSFMLMRLSLTNLALLGSFFCRLKPTIFFPAFLPLLIGPRLMISGNLFLAVVWLGGLR